MKKECLVGARCSRRRYVSEKRHNRERAKIEMAKNLGESAQADRERVEGLRLSSDDGASEPKERLQGCQ